MKVSGYPAFALEAEKLIKGIAVTNTCGYGWYHRCLFSCHISFDSWGCETSSKQILIIRVRILPEAPFLPANAKG